MIIAVDFDNVVHNQKHPVKGRKMGPPMPGALDALIDLYAAHTIIIHTTMANSASGRKAVADWLEYFDVDYHDIVGKPQADFYVDDKSVKSLKEVLRLVGKET